MSDVVELQAEVRRLREDLDAMRNAHFSVASTVDTFRERVEALEKRFAAMESRMTHIDHILIEVQRDLRSLRGQMTAMQDATSKRLDELHGLVTQVLERLSPPSPTPTAPV